MRKKYFMAVDRSILKRLNNLPYEEKQEFLDLIQQIEDAEDRVKAKQGYLDFVGKMWPYSIGGEFINGRHHQIMAETFDRVISGECKRVIINMPPRHTKSEFASFMLPAKYLGHYPHKKILQLSHNADLATGFGRRVRDLIDTPQYQDIFSTRLKSDQKAAGRWNTDQAGSYVSMGIGGRLAGIGADLLIIDDPHSEQEYIQAIGGDASAFDKAYEWYQTGPRQRLQPGAAIVVVMTRWHLKDLTGRLIKRMVQGDQVDQWEVIEFPALLPDTDNPLWPEYWSYDELVATRNELTPQQWSAQYLQNPTAEEGALVKREWWQIWQREDPPECDFVILSLDSAHTVKSTSDYSAFTLWGVFYKTDLEGIKRPNIILLDAWRAKLEFPELKKEAMEWYTDRAPDAFIIEAKASGLPLIQELRRMGIPVQDFTPTRGNDKIVRVNAITDLFASSVVWRPDTRWAEEVVEEFAAFPAGDHDDYVDSSTQALLRFRQGGFIQLASDAEDEEPRRRSFSPY